MQIAAVQGIVKKASALVSWKKNSQCTPNSCNHRRAIPS